MILLVYPDLWFIISSINYWFMFFCECIWSLSVCIQHFHSRPAFCSLWRKRHLSVPGFSLMCTSLLSATIDEIHLRSWARQINPIRFCHSLCVSLHDILFFFSPAFSLLLSLCVTILPFSLYVRLLYSLCHSLVNHSNCLPFWKEKTVAILTNKCTPSAGPLPQGDLKIA